MLPILTYLSPDCNSIAAQCSGHSGLTTCRYECQYVAAFSTLVIHHRSLSGPLVCIDSHDVSPYCRDTPLRLSNVLVASCSWDYLSQKYLLTLVSSLSRTVYELREPVTPITSCPSQSGGICWSFLESKVVNHSNHCIDYGEGYKLGFYYGGQCPAPQRVSACFANETNS